MDDAWVRFEELEAFGSEVTAARRTAMADFIAKLQYVLQLCATRVPWNHKTQNSLEALLSRSQRLMTDKQRAQVNELYQQIDWSQAQRHAPPKNMRSQHHHRVKDGSAPYRDQTNQGGPLEYLMQLQQQRQTWSIPWSVELYPDKLMLEGREAYDIYK